MPSSVPLHPWEWPNRPWSRLHLGYASPFMGKMFLVAVDAHSKWLNVYPLNTCTSTALCVCVCGVSVTRLMGSNSVFLRHIRGLKGSLLNKDTRAFGTEWIQVSPDLKGSPLNMDTRTFGTEWTQVSPDPNALFVQQTKHRSDLLQLLKQGLWKLWF